MIESAVSNSTDEEVLATAEASPQALTANLVGATPGSLDVVQGQLKYSIPINLPEGPAGINPSFSINYSSDAGYGHVGMGFHVGGLSYIERCPMTKTLLRDGYSLGVSGTTDDRLCLDGERLVRVAGSAWADGTVYRTERMSGSKIVYSRTAGADYDQGTFVVYQKNGDIYYYGETVGTRIRGGRHVNNSVSRWALQKVQDRLGYGYEISYVSGSGAKFPYFIRYTTGPSRPIHEVRFFYINDSYDTSWYLFGKKYSSSRVLSKITVKTKAATVRSWNFSYQLNTDTRRRLLTEFQECGVANECLMATTLTWNHGRLSPLSTTVKKTFDAGYWETPWRWWVDVNNDSLTDFCDVDMERVDEPFEEDEYGFEHTVYCYVSNGSGGFGSPVRVTQEDELYTRSISPMNMDPDPFQPAWNLDADWLNYRNWGYQSMCFTVPGDGVDQIVCYHPQISANGAVTFNKSLGQELTLPTVNVRGIKRRDWIDVNGDGYYDYCYRMHISSADRIVCAEGAEPDGAGPRFTGEWVAPTVVVGSLAGIWIDMNADGLPDYCWFTGGSSSSAKCYANKNGALDVTETPWNIGAAHLIKEENAQFWHSGWNDFESTFVDYDGNGYPDYCRIYVDRSVSADAYRASCLRNDGKGWLQDHKSPILNVNPTQVKGLSFSDVNLDSNVDWCLQIGSELKCQLGRFGNFTSATEAYSMPQAPTTLYDHNWSDITGDGVPRLCAAGKNLLQCWNDNNPEVPDYLSSIENGFGLNYRVLYADTTDKHLFGHTEAGESTQLQASMASPYDIGRKLKVKSAIRVVSHLFTSNGIGGETEQAYKYGDYWYYPNEVGGIGFDYIATESEGGKKIKEVWYSMDALQGIAGMPRSETIKYQSNGGYVDVQRKYYTWQPYIYFGNGFVYDNNGQSVTFSSIFDRSTRELRYDVRLVRTNEYNYDLNGSRIRSETNNREYNRYGDLVLDEQFVRGAVGSPGLVRTAESAFSNNEGEWILGRLLQTTTSYVDQIGGSNVVRASEWEYYSSGPFLGMLKSEIIEPGSENEVRTEYTYNAFGLKASQVVTPRGKTPRTSQFGYDPSGRFLTSVTNDIGQTTSFGYDPTTGRKTSQTGPDGVTVSWDYDAVGRQVAEWLPAGQSKRKEMALCLASCPQLATEGVQNSVSEAPASQADVFFQAPREVDGHL